MDVMKTQHPAILKLIVLKFVIVKNIFFNFM